MAKIELKDVTFYYNDFYHPVFEHLTVNLDTDWKMALVGRNGRGKSTLLKLLEGSLEATSGEIRRSGTVSYFPYLYDATFTKAMDVVKECIGGLRTLELKLQRYEENFGEEKGIGQVVPVSETAEYIEVLNQYMELDGYAMESRIGKEVSQMGLPVELLEQDFATLSGGEQTCMLIIALFLRKDAFVLLDEPTNHLDKGKKEHLKAYLKKKKGYIIASHDTVFLDAVSDHILAINKVDISIEQGNYSTWRRNMELKEQFELRTRQKLMQEINQLERQSKLARSWSDVGNTQKYPFASHARTNGTRAYMRQAKAAEQQIKDNLEEKKQLLRNLEEEKRLSIYQEILEQECLLAADNISFCYAGSSSPVLKNVTLHVYPGDKIWLRGKNGAGKTTLLKLLAGQLQGAAIRRRGGLSIAYIAQEPVCYKGEIRHYLRESKGLCSEENFQKLYKKFKELCMLFDLPADFERRPLDTLSSGELKKVDIARTLAEHHQVLFLDEPLNFMDVNFKSQLEAALLDETLTLVFVEHNEEFGERIANKVVEL
ncbi:MAG: ABC-F family ATP-binding cassette domain-containing protein [Lachnospiraceae bacterium]|nr:ABC-F family ATP-binding cassette domain-containing protein [Lachnospiraceae bacterium]